MNPRDKKNENIAISQSSDEDLEDIQSEEANIDEVKQKELIAEIRKILIESED